MSARSGSSPAGAPRPSTRSGNWPTHLRQFSKASLDRSPDAPAATAASSTCSNSPGGTHSSTPALRDRPASRLRVDRRWTVTVNESFAREEVLLNLDLIGPDIKPGCLVAIDVVRADSEKPPQTTLHKQHPHLQDRKDGSSPSAASSASPAACAEKRYICVAKDMPSDLKTQARFSAVEVYVAKHIADAFGMKKGTQVTLTQVSYLSWPYYSLPLCPATD